MKKKDKHTLLSRFALLLLVVFVSSLLIKPVHILLAHHDLSEGVCTNEIGQTITIDHYNDCPICEFEFCTFIPQKQIAVPQVIVIVSKEQTLRTVACFANNSIQLFHLRAPPAL